jgi:hypothetical protein
MDDSYYKSDPALWRAFCSLDAETQARILATDIKISTPGELLECADHAAHGGFPLFERMKAIEEGDGQSVAK